MHLELGAQTRAAQLVVDGMADVMEPVQALSNTIVASASGFRGQSSAALGQALQSWFEVVNRLPDVLGGYAGDLAAVDQTTGAADVGGASGLGTAYGSSGLNMGVDSE